jgi:RNA polymerase sigma factor (sigma-70 family)
MADLSEADRYLLEQIKKGNLDGWTQLVQRYQGRLLAFARSRMSRDADAEDLVQDTFLAFLQNLKNFKQELSLETYLFMILRRRIIDLFRGKNSRVCFLHETAGDSDAMPIADALPARDESASTYVRRDERDDNKRELLANGLRSLLARLQEQQNFRDLKLLEMLFYGQMRNKDIARLSGVDEKQVALIKHRALNHIKEHIEEAGGNLEEWDAADASSSLLTEVWEEQRLTCPKRSTIGRHLLGTLDEPWKGYVEFHVKTLGCTFCKANIEDLQKQTAEAPKALEQRVLQSTIGFFNKA